MTTPIPRHESGERVRAVLMHVSPDGLSKARLLEETELTESQVANGIVWIREVAASEHLTPLTYSRRDGYRFSDDPADWSDYERSQMLRIFTTTLRTFKGTIDPHLQRAPDDNLARLMNAHANAMMASLDQLTRQPGNTHAGVRSTPR